MSDAPNYHGGRIEQRLQQALVSSSGPPEPRAAGLLSRTSRTVRRGSFVLALGWLGLSFFAAAWVLFNVAMHGWAAARWSVVTAYFVVMALNLGGGGILVLIAALLAPTVEAQLHEPRSAPEPGLLTAEPGPPADSMESALGSAIELGLLAAQTIPQLIRAFRKPKSPSELQPKS